MPAEPIDHSALATLAETRAVRTVQVVGQNGGWRVIVKDAVGERPLAAQRGNVRLFRKLETVVGYLNSVGISRFEVDATNYDPDRKRRARPDRAEALKRAHEAAAYDKWFREQIQAAIDDPRLSISHEEVSARWTKRRTQLMKKLKSGQGIKA